MGNHQHHPDLFLGKQKAKWILQQAEKMLEEGANF
jgi:hypothetical protein